MTIIQPSSHVCSHDDHTTIKPCAPMTIIQPSSHVCSHDDHTTFKPCAPMTIIRPSSHVCSHDDHTTFKTCAPMMIIPPSSHNPKFVPPSNMYLEKVNKMRILKYLFLNILAVHVIPKSTVAYTSGRVPHLRYPSPSPSVVKSTTSDPSMSSGHTFVLHLDLLQLSCAVCRPSTVQEPVNSECFLRCSGTIGHIKEQSM
ncbi:hypothetical protein MAR_023776 [Mya arenaria]|uniref:Uncharacterized protein n=1 Tax=Mya arenaria TaxID=6604 RepID=A0ABY7DTH5_MYAAR|nr:hypothetical protein MAR_023776 [Mya arenaria]